MQAVRPETKPKTDTSPRLTHNEAKRLAAAIILQAVEDAKGCTRETVEAARKFLHIPAGKAGYAELKRLREAESALGWLLQGKRVESEAPGLTFSDCLAVLGLEPEGIRDKILADLAARGLRVGNDIVGSEGR